jgi:hypothetical protein
LKSRTTLRVGLVTAALALVLLVAASPVLAQSPRKRPALTPTPRDSLTRALASGEITPAKYALERATALFHPVRVATRYGIVRPADPRAATLILRDLAIRVRYLSGADRERALALLARPTDNPNPDDSANTYGATPEQTPVCGTDVCIHYVISGQHAVDTTDNLDANGAPGANGVPDYVDEALRVFDTEVWGFEVATRGYRAPKSDITSVDNGASASDPTGAKFDVYLAQLGDDGLYGYCTSDDPHLQGGYSFFDMSAYCVVDNNYTESIFNAHSPLENLEVTAAHEFFHAVQFAYDAFEDQWFLESTATWMEDELYDSVNDNVQYLPDGPLGKPRVPLDKGATKFDTCCHVYGDWIFFRYLTEKYGPGLVKSSWNKADASEDTDGPGPDGVGPDMYSIQAVAKTLSTKGGFRKNFANFGWANRISRRVYQEGKANAYPQAPLSDPATTLSGTNRSKSETMSLDHQTNAYLEFKRGSGLSSKVKLKLSLNLPSKSTGAAASVLVYMKNGTVSPFILGITSAGDGDFKIPFGSSVKKVDLVLTNASTRYTNCYPAHHPTPYACDGGTPRDDGVAYDLTAHV